MNIYFQKNHQRSFGTYPLQGEELANSIATAAEVGYRAFDTAQMYENEADTGAALKATGIAREDLCITTKVNINKFTEAEFIPSVEQSLRDLQTDYVDVLLLHWPPADGQIETSLRLLEGALKRGADQEYRCLELHRRDAASGRDHRRRPDRHQPGRVPPAPEPGQTDGRGERSRHSAFGILLRRAR